MRILAGLASLLALALGGCGESATTHPQATGRVLPVDYTKFGGVGGITQRLSVDARGGARLDGYAFTLRADEREELAAAEKDVDFAANAGHDRGDAHPDAFVYGLIVDGRTILDGDYVIPSPVTPLVGVLDRLAIAHSPERRALERKARHDLVLFSRDGGVAGEHVELRIAPDGGARVMFGAPPYGGQVVKVKVNAGLLASVKHELDAGDPEGLRSSQDPNLVVADGFSYLVIARGTTITATDPVSNQRLERLLEALGQIVESARPKQD